jgi:cobalt/nickel transport system permease protein
MTSVVSIQALIFQDGGLVVLGANLFNMAVVGVFVSYFVYRTIQRIASGRTWGIFIGSFVAAWTAIFVAALAAALQLALSGTSPANIAVPAMGGVHALIGIGEGLITLGALSFLFAARRDLFRADRAQPAGGRFVWVVGLIIAFGLAVISPLASTHPDGLEWVAEQQGFLNLAQAPTYQIIPDYVLPGVPDEALATILAGIVGALVVFGVAFAIAYTRRNRAMGRG